MQNESLLGKGAIGAMWSSVVTAVKMSSFMVTPPEEKKLHFDPLVKKFVSITIKHGLPTTSKQRPLFCGPSLKLYIKLILLNNYNDYLLITIFGSKGWSFDCIILRCSLSVIQKHLKGYKKHALLGMVNRFQA